MTKNEVVYVSSTVHVSKQTNQNQVQLLKCHCYNTETRGYSSAINLHMQVHSTEAHKFCQAGSLVEIETYNK